MRPLVTTRIYPTEYLKTILDTQQQWGEYINSLTNFTFVKFGDGELFCMMGMMGENCDRHPYSPGLAQKLHNAWNYFSTCNLPHLYIAEWGTQPGSFGTPQYITPLQTPDQPGAAFLSQLLSKYPNRSFKLVNYEILMHHMLSEQKFNFFNTIKHTTRKKILVGPERLSAACSFLNINTHLQIPLVNAFERYDSVLQHCKDVMEDNAIFMFCGGMPTKSLVGELMQYNSNVTYLDIGSGFDPLFVGNTREGQIPENMVKEYYKELL